MFRLETCFDEGNMRSQGNYYLFMGILTFKYDQSTAHG